MFGTSTRAFATSGLLAIALVATVHATDAPKPVPSKPGMPTDPKAMKTYKDAMDWLKVGARSEAINSLRKAARQDSHCTECLRQAYSIANSMGKYKEAEEIAREWLPIAATDVDRASAHYRIALALQQQGISDKKKSASTKVATNSRLHCSWNRSSRPSITPWAYRLPTCDKTTRPALSSPTSLPLTRSPQMSTNAPSATLTASN